MNKFLDIIGYNKRLEDKDRVAYIIGAIGTLQLLSFLFFYIFVVGSSILIFQTIIILIGYLSVFALFKYKHFLWGKVIIVCGITIQVALLVFVWFPVESYLVMFFFIVPPMSFFIMDIGNPREKKVLIGINVAVCLLIGAFGIIEPLEIVVLSQEYVRILKIMSIVSTVLAEVLVFYFYASSLYKTHGKLRILANTDALTQVANRRVLFDQGELLFDLCYQYGRSFTLMILDIDYFKSINDKYGHPAGDSVLKELCDLIAENIRKEDMLCRYGGEEFAILFRNTDVDHKHIIQKIQDRINHHEFKVVDKQYIHLTVSAGVVVCNKSAKTFDDLVKKADALLYQAKVEGRNRIYYDY